MPSLSFQLNGQKKTVDSLPATTTVLEWLRLEAGLTGTKEGCAEGDCGACTVALARREDDGTHWRAVNSCLLTLGQIDGLSIRTVEGLANPDGTLHPVQQAMVETDGTQCGFCSPGFVMSMFAFAEGGEPGEDDLIHEAIAGNLCRCTGYRPIVDACREIAGKSGSFDPADGLLPPEQVSESYGGSESLFLAPKSSMELAEMMDRHPDAWLLSGGTDIGLEFSKKGAKPEAVISLARVGELRRIELNDEGLTFGAAVTYTELLPHLDDIAPAFGQLVRRIGSRQIRNLGSIGGNIVTASPIGDTAPCLMALEATVTIAGLKGRRTLPLTSFITGYRQTALEAGEFVESIHIPRPAPDAVFAAYKISRRFDQDISAVVAAFLLERDGDRVTGFRAAYGGVGPVTLRAAGLEAVVNGSDWDMDTITRAKAAVAEDISPIDDFRATAEYRRRIAANLLERFFHETTDSEPVRLETL
jgi:xanthine dehydrogenase small subunit